MRQTIRLVVIGIAGLVFGAPSMAASGKPDLVVTSSEQLSAAVARVAGGQVIRLAPGVYSIVKIINAKFDTPLVITSASPSNPAVIAGLGIANSSGVTFTNVEFTSVGAPDGYYAFRLAGSQNLTFNNVNVHGDINGKPGEQLMGFYVSHCSSITFKNSKFHHINLAILTGYSNRITITGNQFYYLNKSGVQMAATSDVLIADNQFTNFILTPKTHPDVVQFFTAGTKIPSTKITITGNLYYRGTGQAAQGIFFGDETGSLPYSGLTITNNAMIGGMWNAIYLNNVAADTHVSNNYVASWPDSETAFKAWIFLTGDAASQPGVLQGNHAQQYIIDHRSTVPDGNDLLEGVSDNGISLLRRWQAEGHTITGALGQ